MNCKQVFSQLNRKDITMKKEVEVITEILNDALKMYSNTDYSMIDGLLYLIKIWYNEREYVEFYDRVYGMAWALECTGLITLEERNEIFDCLLKGFTN